MVGCSDSARAAASATCSRPAGFDEGAHVGRRRGVGHHLRQEDVEALNHREQHATDRRRAAGGAPAPAGGKDSARRGAGNDGVPRVLLFADGDQRAVEAREEPAPDGKVACAQRRQSRQGVSCQSACTAGIQSARSATRAQSGAGAHLPSQEPWP